jgi:hypothetical protein
MFMSCVILFVVKVATDHSYRGVLPDVFLILRDLETSSMERPGHGRSCGKKKKK